LFNCYFYDFLNGKPDCLTLRRPNLPRIIGKSQASGDPKPNAGAADQFSDKSVVSAPDTQV